MNKNKENFEINFKKFDDIINQPYDYEFFTYEEEDDEIKFEDLEKKAFYNEN